MKKINSETTLKNPSPILLDAQIIKTLLPAHPLPIQLDVLSEIDSTNDYFKSNIITPDAIHFCLAEQQTAGRGRLGRDWFSPFGTNIYLSCLWSFSKDVSALSGLSLAVGIAVIKALNELTPNPDIKIKWPNDILYQQQKLAGILIEVNTVDSGNTQAIIGIGLNVNMSDQNTETINQPWTSLQHIIGNEVDRNKIAALLIHNLLCELSKFSKQGLKPFLTQWQQYDALLNQQINLLHGKQNITGVVLGINPQGYLLLEHNDGSTAAYSSGDSTLCKP